jgi:hypothetical protein
VTVGDGDSGHGDFDSVEDALANLPAEGGEVCLLPGRHQANATITNGRNITIKGCGRQTRVTPRESNRESPIFRVVDGQGITLRDMELVTLGGTAIVLEGSEAGALQGIDIAHNRILAFRQAIQVSRGSEIHVHDNHIRLLDKQGAGVAIQVLAEDGVIEHNDIGVVPADRTPPPLPPGGTIDPTDPCADLEIIYANPAVLTLLIDQLFGLPGAAVGVAPFRALGGIQIAAGSERVKVLDNTIHGGAGNGITLGGTLPGPAVPPEDEPQHVIESTRDHIYGHVLQGGSGLAGVSLAFLRAGADMPLAAVSGSGGLFGVEAESAKYAVSFASPGFKIESIDVVDTSIGRFHNIHVAVEERPEPEDVFSFLYEIQIDRNEIAHMGLSGIGFPIVEIPAPDTTTTAVVQNPGLAASLALLGNPVATLGIHRNHIHDCLQNTFDGGLRAESKKRGFGGISLGHCENVTISGNRIERNGTSHINPACGIFIRLGEKVDIYHNNILDNGPPAPGITQRLEGGFRGGIVLSASSIGTAEVIARPEKGFDTGRHAARVHDNIVCQPVGQALRLLALGPTSMNNNRFVSDGHGPETIESLAGVVFVLTIGNSFRIGDPAIPTRLPAGLTLFNSNQSRMGGGGTSLAQLIMTLQDLGFDGNQCDVMTDDAARTDNVLLTINTFLVGNTLRATGSRFIEPPSPLPEARTISLYTLALSLNNTNLNHGDHCIFASCRQAGKLNEFGNQVIDDAGCRDLGAKVAVPPSRFPIHVTLGGK